MTKYIADLVSVIIPTYHRAEKLNRAVDSVLAQTYKKLECIVVNDNIPNDEYSKNVYELIKKYKDDPRFIFIEQEKHINGAEARNCGIRRAKGEFIAFLDDDDWWKPEKIERLIHFIRQQPLTCGGVSTLVEFHSNGEAVRWTKPYKDGKIYLQILRRDVDVVTSSVLLKHEALDDAGYFDNSLNRHQELQLLSYFTYKYEIKLLPEYLTCNDYDSKENYPNSEQLILIKRKFFKSVKPIMNTLSRAQKRSVYAVHNLEIASVEYREKKYKKALKKGLRVLFSPSFFMIFSYIRRRNQAFQKPVK